MSGTTEGIYTESKQHRRLMAQMKPSRQLSSHMYTHGEQQDAEKAAQLGWQLTGIVDMDKGTKGKKKYPEEVPRRSAHACNLAHRSVISDMLASPHVAE